MFEKPENTVDVSKCFYDQGPIVTSNH